MLASGLLESRVMSPPSDEEISEGRVQISSIRAGGLHILLLSAHLRPCEPSPIPAPHPLSGQQL